MYFGIDYSMTSPAVCAMDDDGNLKGMMCFAQRKRELKIQSDLLEILEYPSVWENNIERFDMISDTVLEFIRKHSEGTGEDMVFLEGYAYGATGSRVFQVAENCGILKLKIVKAGYPLYMIPPAQAKKHATGRGTANKLAMYDAFRKLYPEIDLVGIFKTGKSDNPVSDLTDSVLGTFAGFCRHLPRDRSACD